MNTSDRLNPFTRGITGVSKGPCDLAVPLETPTGQEGIYQLGALFQLSDKQAGMFCNIRRASVHANDLEMGSGLVMFDIHIPAAAYDGATFRILRDDEVAADGLISGRLLSHFGSSNAIPDGTDLAANPHYLLSGRTLQHREWLALWPLAPDRRSVLPPMIIRDSADFGPGPQSHPWWLDHPLGCTLRLAAGVLRHLLAYRVLGKPRGRLRRAPGPADRLLRRGGVFGQRAVGHLAILGSRRGLLQKVGAVFFGFAPPFVQLRQPQRFDAAQLFDRQVRGVVEDAAAQVNGAEIGAAQVGAGHVGLVQDGDREVRADRSMACIAAPRR